MNYTIGHACYYVRNRDQALDFYCGKLGLEFMFEQTFPQNNMYIIYVRVAKRQYIELIGNFPHEDKLKASFAHLCLHVEDIYEAHRELTEKGLTLTDVEIGHSRCIKCYLDDPDGNTIDLMQLPEDSLQILHDHE